MRGLSFIRKALPGHAVQLGLLPLATLYAALPPALATWIDVPCLWTALLGVICLGCGFKSALARLLHGDLAGGVAINALSPVVLALVVYLFITSLHATLTSQHLGERRAWPN